MPYRPLQISTITPNSLLLSKQSNTRVSRCFRLYDVVLALRTIDSKRHRRHLRWYQGHPYRKSLVNPIYLILKVVHGGFILRVNRGLLLAEASDTQGWCSDRDSVNGSKVGACYTVVGVAGLDRAEFSCVLAGFVYVFDSWTHGTSFSRSEIVEILVGSS